MEPLKEILARLMGQERLAKIQGMSPEQLREYRNQLLAPEGIYLDEQGREFFRLPAGLTVEERLDQGGFPKGRRFRASLEQNPDFEALATPIRQYAKQGRHLYLFGSPQSGKTRLALHLAWRYLQRKPHAGATYISLPFLLDRLLEDNKKIQEVSAGFGELVVLDDLPTRPGNPWVQETLLKLMILLEQMDGSAILIGSCPKREIFAGSENLLPRLHAKLEHLAGEIRLPGVRP